MAFFRTLRSAAAEEIKAIFGSTYLLGLLTWIPLIVFGLIAVIFWEGVVHDLPIAVVDKDGSRLSRALKFDLDASPALSTAGQPEDMKEAAAWLRQNRVYAIVVIPAHFERDVMRRTQPQVEAMVNAQYILIGKLITSFLSKSVMQESTKLDVVFKLETAKRFGTALDHASPIGMQVTPFFNTYQNYFPFLVSALIPALWQLFIVVAVIVTLGRTLKAGELSRLKEESFTAAVLGKLLPSAAAYMLWGAFFLFFMYVYLPWPFEGSFGVTLAAMALTLFAYQGVALLLLGIELDYARALSLGAFYTAPAFAFMGITFPTVNMPAFAQFWNEMLPIAHYMRIQIAEANYGAPLQSIVPAFAAIALFYIAWPVALWRLRRHAERS